MYKKCFYFPLIINTSKISISLQEKAIGTFVSKTAPESSAKPNIVVDSPHSD